MGVALGWMALALAAVSGTPDSGRGGVPIRYTVRYMEAEGVEWREAVFTRLTPVTRQGSATVWTAPHDVAKKLVLQAKTGESTAMANASTVIARSGSAAHTVTGSSRQLVTQAAWNGDGHSVEAKSERVRTGSAATLIGRKLDQGILVQMVLKDTQILAVHRVPMATAKVASANGAADHSLCSCAQNVAFGEGFPPGRYMQDDVKYFTYHSESPWSDIPAIVDSDPAKRPTTANVNQKRMPIKAARREDKQAQRRLQNAMAEEMKKRQKRGITKEPAPQPTGEVVAASASATVSDCSSATASCDSCCQGDEASKVALEVPEIGSQEIAGEWLIPNDGILLVSFGPHTVADKDGKAVVRERLAIVEAVESAETLPMPSYLPHYATVPPIVVPNAQPAPWTIRSFSVPVLPVPESTAPVPEAVAPVRISPPDMPAAPMPPVPSRSIPQGYHTDGKVADLPPLPPETDDDEDPSDSSEPRPSPQTTKPRPDQSMPEAKPRPSQSSADSAARKAQYTVPGFPTIPAMFQSSNPAVGLQFLVPIKPVSFKLPFNRRLELEIFGRVVHAPEPVSSSAELVAKPAKDGTATK